VILSSDIPWKTRRITSRQPFGGISVGARALHPRSSPEPSDAFAGQGGLSGRGLGSFAIIDLRRTGSLEAACQLQFPQSESNRSDRVIVPKLSASRLKGVPGICVASPNLRKRLQRFCRISTLKSSNVPIRSADLWSCQNALRGSIAAEGSPRIGRISTERRSRTCASICLMLRKLCDPA
jgi:hypothetical protein